MDWSAATITVTIIITLAVVRTTIDRGWPEAIGSSLHAGIVVVPQMVSQHSSQSDHSKWVVVERNTRGKGNEAIVFPALYKTVKLPIGERVEVEFNRGELRRLEFTCQRKKMRGVVEFST